ncbi:MAG: hypothetical protein RR288_07200, partial [Oscillibacter sp.]
VFHLSAVQSPVPQKARKILENLREAFLLPLLSDLEQNDEYSFLKKDPVFEPLIAEYQSKIK